MNRKTLFSSVLLLIYGCIHGSAALPTIAATKVFNTNYSVYLCGPDRMGVVGYYLETSELHFCGYRSLGRLDIALLNPVHIERVSGEV